MPLLYFPTELLWYRGANVKRSAAGERKGTRAADVRSRIRIFARIPRNKNEQDSLWFTAGERATPNRNRNTRIRNGPDEQSVLQVVKRAADRAELKEGRQSSARRDTSIIS